MDPAKMNKTLQQFAMENQKMEMTGEMMGDAIDDALDDEQTEEETGEWLHSLWLYALSVELKFSLYMCTTICHAAKCRQDRAGSVHCLRDTPVM